MITFQDLKYFEGNWIPIYIRMSTCFDMNPALCYLCQEYFTFQLSNTKVTSYWFGIRSWKIWCQVSMTGNCSISAPLGLSCLKTDWCLIAPLRCKHIHWRRIRVLYLPLFEEADDFNLNYLFIQPFSPSSNLKYHWPSRAFPEKMENFPASPPRIISQSIFCWPSWRQECYPCMCAGRD